MSNVGLFFFLCLLRFAQISAFELQIAKKTFCCIFFTGFLFVLEKKHNYAKKKTLSLLVAFFAVLLSRKKQKKPFVSTKEPF